MQNNRYSPNPRKYYKSNYVDAVELITPKVYQQEDLQLSGTEINPLSLIINSHIRAAANISDVLSISGVADTQTSSLGNISGISQYFVKQNNLTQVTPYILEHKILLPLGTTFANYSTSGEFNDYLSGTLLPSLIPATGSEKGSPLHNITTLSALTNNPDPSSIHNYLIDALGWFYFLNTSADGGLDYSPSSYVLSSLNTLYTGNSLETIDGVKGFVEYIWRNYETCSTFGSLGLIPTTFVSGTTDARTETSAGPLPTYTSGTQKLYNLQTLIDVVYSPLFIDQQDYTVKAAFDDYMNASIQLSDRVSKGPFRKFSNLLGFEFADISNEMDNLGLIYDIENSRDENLQYIAQLIGWRLRGNSADGWRHQLRQAVTLYKKSGTLEAIQTAVNLLITDSVLDVSAATTELWESYLPYMIWYALGTESPLFRNLNTWSFGLSQQAGLTAYNTSSLEANMHIVVDDIMLKLYKAFPENFIFSGERFPVPRLINVDERGQAAGVYAIVGEPRMPPFHAHIITQPGYETARREAYSNGHKVAWDSAISLGPLGSGVYMKGLEHPNYALGEVPSFLSGAGDLEFTFSYRDKLNYPLPPFEEVKYYKDSNLSVPLLELLAEQLRCYQVKKSFVSDFKNYVLSAGINTDTDLGSLNEMLMFFSSVQIPPNFDNVMLDISNYEKNLLDLWNGKSSHIFVDFTSGDFDFSQDTLEADGKNALSQASRITREFAPGHTIPKVNLNASTSDTHAASSTNWTYLGFDEDGTRVSYASASVLGNFEYSGVNMGGVAPGTTNGRGGLNTFKREDVNKITDSLLESTDSAILNNVGRRALRRRNFKYLLPKEGYYDRTGFNGPTNWDLVAQNPNLLVYTEDLGGSPGLDMNVAPTNGSSIDIIGTYWQGNKSKLGTFSSTLETNPFGGASSTDMSATQFTAGGQAALYETKLDGLSDPRWREDYYTIQSWYVKKPPTNPTPTFKINNYDWTAPVDSNSVSFEWDGNEAVIKTLHNAGTTAYVESVGNDWYRCSITSEGLGGGGDTVDGDKLMPYFYLIHAASDPVHLYISSPQLEQKLISHGDALPSPYQGVSESRPTNKDNRGLLTLGYVASAGQFFPVVDAATPSGVWNICENLESEHVFSGVTSKDTFPFRGTSGLHSNYFLPPSSTDRYVDRDQLPLIYNTMHQLFEQKALDYAAQETNFDSSSYLTNVNWKNQLQSLANSAIADGLVLNSYEDYINFSFGRGMQETYSDYIKYFGGHPLGRTSTNATGGSIFAQVFGKGLFNCDFDLTGYAATTNIGGNYVASSVNTGIPISQNSGSGVFSTCAVAAYSTGAALPASGSYIAKYPGQGVVPLSGAYIPYNPNNAEFRNPNILSGIEFTDISGSPIANQFGIFKVNSSFAVPGKENTLIENTVIKCKSLGGLPRLRYNLKEYGDSPNHFIKDHVFKLKVKALVGDETSNIFGGGRLGAWIHTEPEYSNNYFMWTNYNKAGGAASTENEGLARITGHGNLTPTFPAQVADIPPGFENKFLYEASGTSALEMNFGVTTTGTYSYIGAINTSANVSEDQEYVFSLYAKTIGYDSATTGIALNMYEGTGVGVSFRAIWTWGTDGVPVFLSRTSASIKHRVQEVGNGWYRFSLAMTGKEMLDANSNVAVGDNLRLIWYMDRPGEHGNILNKKLRFWGPQMEVYDKGTNKALKNGVANPGPFKWVSKITQPEDPPRYIWSWTPNGKWEYMKESDISIPKVLELSHMHTFPTYDGASVAEGEEDPYCLNNLIEANEGGTNSTLLNINNNNIETFEVSFDTRNFTINNNFEYLDIIPIPGDVYKITNQVNQDTTNYVVELFFVPNSDPNKYMLIESVGLQDVTQRENAALGTGHGIETSGIPNRRFVKEDKLYLTKDQLWNTLKFYNGLIGQGTGVYATNLASRDATITSGIMEVEGGSRLNYRIAPAWTVDYAKQSNYNNTTNVELDN